MAAANSNVTPPAAICQEGERTAPSQRRLPSAFSTSPNISNVTACSEQPKR
eukprot:m.127767 g.127767  ORF g.127767 m.127767 type:complete len:51 (-) comp52272_c0_seq1:1197-1349(-)